MDEVQNYTQKPPQEHHSKGYYFPPHRKILLSIIFLFFAAGLVYGGYQLGRRTSVNSGIPVDSLTEISNQFTPSTQPTTIPIGDTVSFIRFADSILLRYRGIIYSPNNLVHEDPLVVNLPNESYTWIDLVLKPKTPLGNYPEIFSFKVFPNKQDFILVMDGEEHYEVFYYQSSKNITSSILSTTQKEKFAVIKIDQISLDGKYISLNTYGCWNCGAGLPEILLMNIETGKTNRLKNVTYFRWLSNGKYEYKEFKSKEGCREMDCAEPDLTVPSKFGVFR